MTTPVDAERAWQDLQRIRVPQERVYDEVERCAQSDQRGTYVTAGLMWLFLASWGLDLPKWGGFALLAVYVGALAALAVVYSRRSRMRLHRSRYGWRSVVTFFAGGALSGGMIILTGRLTDWLALPYGSLIQATLSAGAFVLFVGPANRWAVSPLRGRGLSDPTLRTVPEEAGR
ncbi:hypothetical protein HEK616_02980 [Streptomyces nigrescens]|uniref:Integral membrane protein n=2 Tax=Streptomyces TaxID=1883 RepID=A0ABN6QLZ9_STRNI|nr:hypothetical protein [Streptomyces nigrescens]MEE4424846.1 hypothetical protein [Streptomyces sp. DSM 41528]BDM66811.1 hypothetical protein HEK616_02980 [Streptomyces nigrescens]